jgi:hypothetical protein
MRMSLRHHDLTAEIFTTGGVRMLDSTWCKFLENLKFILVEVEDLVLGKCGLTGLIIVLMQPVTSGQQKLRDFIATQYKP